MKRFVPIMLIAFVYFLEGCSMQSKFSHPGSDAIVTFDDGEFTEFYAVAVNPQSRELVSFQFFESRPDLGEIKLLKKVEWDTKVPEDAHPFVAASGILRDKLNTFWTGWKDGKKIHAISLFHEDPIVVDYPAGGKFIDPPIVLAGKNMQQYYVAPGETQSTIRCLEFAGDSAAKVPVATHDIFTLDHEPLLCSAAPVIGSVEKRACLAWLQVAGDGCILSVLPIIGDSAGKVISLPIDKIKPLAKQKLALQAFADGLVCAGFVGETEGGGYLLVKCGFNLQKGTSEAQKVSLTLTPGSIQSARVVYYKIRDWHESFGCFLTNKNEVYVTSGESGLVLLEKEVGPGYDYPIVTSYTGRYEAKLDHGWEVYLEPIR